MSAEQRPMELTQTQCEGSNLLQGSWLEQPSPHRAGKLFPNNLTLCDASVPSSRVPMQWEAAFGSAAGSARLWQEGACKEQVGEPWLRIPLPGMGQAVPGFPSCELRVTRVFGRKRGSLGQEVLGCSPSPCDAVCCHHSAAAPGAGFIRGPAHVPGTFPTLGLSH